MVKKGNYENVTTRNQADRRCQDYTAQHLQVKAVSISHGVSMSEPESTKARCANFACKCEVEADLTVCSDYCAAAEGWESEVQTEMCACGHPHCTSANHSAAPHAQRE